LPLSSALPAAPPDAAAGYPARCILQLCLGVGSPSYPGYSLPWLRLMVHRVSSVPAPSGFAVPASSGFPESCIYGWVDDDSRFSSNFASSARLRMNLRIQSGFALSRLTLDAFSQSHSGFHLPANRPVYLRLQLHPASFCQAGTAFPIPCQVDAGSGFTRQFMVGLSGGGKPD